MRKLLPHKSLGLCVATALTVLALTACGATSPAGYSGSSVATVAPVSAPGPNSGESERGALIKSIGERAGMTNTDGTVLVEFTVDKISAAKCNAYADPPSGRYIAVDLTVKTKADPERRLSSIMFGNGWEYVAADGTSTEASTMSAASCDYGDANLAPNRTYHITAVLDVPKNSSGGVIVYRSGGGGPLTNGWEWKLDT